jgi:vanillate/3-O-methylgallate O-demethylase
MTAATGTRSLQDLMNEKPDLVDYFYNETAAPHPMRYSRLDPWIPKEFTNWRDEQRAWRETAILLDQSHHMPELFLSGPDALALLEKVGINTFANFSLDRGKQLVGCTPQGHLVGDCILYRLGEDSFELVSGMPLLNWVHYQAELNGYNVTIKRDDPTPSNPTGRRVKYRFQMDGPNAGLIFSEMVDGDAPSIPFFHTATVKVAGCEVLVLRHGMAGHQGVELSGPYDELETVRAAILKGGEPHGLQQGGTTTYFSTLFESAWMAQPLPGIYTDENLREYREWLAGDSWEARQHIGGSFYSSNIENYYAKPWDLGYDRIMKFDHDFIGRSALEAQKDAPHRTKVSLIWNEDDVLKVYRSQFGDRPRYKSIELPVAYFGFPQCDEVRNQSGDFIGLSSHVGYSNNDGLVVSLSSLEEGEAELGSEVLITWGEPGGGSRKPEVERHQQVEVRATVASAPYLESVRQTKTAAIGSSIG